jgi:serine O-acetyltransferase
MLPHLAAIDTPQHAVYNPPTVHGRKGLRTVFSLLREEIRAVKERDPAARGTVEILFCYAGLHAIIAHRIAHWLWERKVPFLPRLISHISRWITGIEIHPGAKIGKGLFIDHGMGTVIGETTEIGDNVTLFQGVTLGGTGKERGKRHPTLRDNVVVGSHAQILGSFEIGEGAVIGSGAVVLSRVPPNSTVVGVPGRIVREGGVRRYGFEHDKLPDPIRNWAENLLRSLQEHLRQAEALSNRIAALEANRSAPDAAELERLRQTVQAQAERIEELRAEVDELRALQTGGGPAI